MVSSGVLISTVVSTDPCSCSLPWGLSTRACTAAFAICSAQGPGRAWLPAFSGSYHLLTCLPAPFPWDVWPLMILLADVMLGWYEARGLRPSTRQPALSYPFLLPWDLRNRSAKASSVPGEPQDIPQTESLPLAPFPYSCLGSRGSSC